MGNLALEERHRALDAMPIAVPYAAAHRAILFEADFPSGRRRGTDRIPADVPTSLQANRKHVLYGKTLSLIDCGDGRSKFGVNVR
jgi:hypothetical protein